MQNTQIYMPLNALDKIYKPLVLKWLCKLFNYPDYPHSFKDQWIRWSIWDGVLSVGFDFRQEEHKKLFSLIHPRFIGCIQQHTLKIVNTTSFFLDLDCLLNIQYPDIIGSKLIRTNKHKGGTGGWYSKSDNFYSYDWEVLLSDGNSLFYNNQKENMDMIKGDFIYTSRIQERAFCVFLEQFID